MEGFNWFYVWQIVTAAIVLGCLRELKSIYTVTIELKTWATDHEKLDNARFDWLKGRLGGK